MKNFFLSALVTLSAILFFLRERDKTKQIKADLARRINIDEHEQVAYAALKNGVENENKIINDIAETHINTDLRDHFS